MAWTPPPPAQSAGNVIPAAGWNTFRTNILELQAGLPKAFSAYGVGAAGFINEGTIASVTVPAQPYAGVLIVTGSLFVFKSVAANQSFIRLRQTNLVGPLLANDQEAGAAQRSGHPVATVSMAANTGLTVVMTVAIVGGGSGTVYGDGTNNRIDALWVAT